MVARVKRACMVLLVCVVVCGKALEDPLGRLSSEDAIKPTEGAQLSSGIASRIKREVVQPALVMVAASVTYFVLLPVATAGLPAAAGASLVASGVAAIGVSFQLHRGDGEDEDASTALGRNVDCSSATCDKKIKRLEREVKRERVEVEKAKEDAKKAKSEAKKAKAKAMEAKAEAMKAKAETAATRTKMANMQGALDDAKNMCQAPRNATTML